MIVYTNLDSFLGTMLLTSYGQALTGVYFVGQKYKPKPGSEWRPDPDSRLFDKVKFQLFEYFLGKRQVFDVPIRLLGTSFQVQVWEAIASIPFGSTISYGTLAKRVGRSKAVRAVGAAVGHNPVSIIVPCHRVIGSDGSLTGYAGGLERKRALLDIEKGAISLPPDTVGLPDLSYPLK